jgi:hypothetical protein
MLQHEANSRFKNSDLKAMRIIASQLAVVLENAKIIISLQGDIARLRLR